MCFLVFFEFYSKIMCSFITIENRWIQEQQIYFVCVAVVLSCVSCVCFCLGDG